MLPHPGHRAGSSSVTRVCGMFPSSTSFQAAHVWFPRCAGMAPHRSHAVPLEPRFPRRMRGWSPETESRIPVPPAMRGCSAPGYRCTVRREGYPSDEGMFRKTSRATCWNVRLPRAAGMLLPRHLCYTTEKRFPVYTGMAWRVGAWQ